MTRIIAIRPEPGLSSTIELGREMGLTILGQPLFEIRPIEWQAPDPETVDALLIGSANAFRHGGSNLAQFREKPAYVVGKATKNAACDAGFRVAATGTGGMQNVLNDITAHTRLLRIAGAEHVPLNVPEGISIQTEIAYESVALPLDRDLFSDAETPLLILLHSAVAAEHFASECRWLKIDPAKVSVAALGPRIASAAGHGWAAIHVADAPNDAALLAMVRGLWQ